MSPARNSGWVKQPAKEPEVGGDPEHDRLGEHRGHALDAGVPILGVGDHLRQQRIVVDADLSPVRTPVSIRTPGQSGISNRTSLPG